MIFSNREYIEIRNSNFESNLFAFQVFFANFENTVLEIA